MAATKTTATAGAEISATAAGAPAPEAPILLTASEACQRISETTKAVEALAAFHAEQQALGLTSGTFAEFEARFRAFMARPIG